LCGRPTGVGRYLSGLLDGWSGSDAMRRHEWTLIAPSAPAAVQRWPVAVKVVPGPGGTSWEQFTLPRAVSAEGADVFFAPGYTAPLTVAAPVVLTIHDVSFFAHPEWFSFREGARRRTLTAWSARRAKRVITDTEFSRSEIIRYIGLPPARVHTIPLGLSRSTDAPASAAGREPIVLYAGSIFERRRVDRLIAAFDLVAAAVPEARLEIVGENRTRRPRLDLDALRNRTRHSGRIHIRSYVDDATLSDLYRRASVFAFLSEYEGFGFTPLEALSGGVPPVLLDTQVARETCGEAARYVSGGAGDEEIAGAITDLLRNTDARAAILRHAEDVIARFDWSRTAARTLTALEEAAIG
jgi:glycosyltransferase involved in cell wall biosynthesis